MPNYAGFAGSTLLHKGGGFEPARKSNFAAVIYGVGNAGDIVLQLQDTNVPGAKISKQSMKHFNETVHYAGSVEPPDDWDLHYRDFVDRDILTSLAGWMKEVWDPSTGGIGRAGAYKKCGEIIFLDPAGATHKVWSLEGVFPTTLDTDGFDYDDDGTPVKIHLVCSVDRSLPPGLG